MDLISRKCARELGLSRYYTGKPCKHGHVSERLVINGSCCECSRLKSKRDYHDNREHALQQQKKYRNSEKFEKVKRERIRRDKLANPDKYERKERIEEDRRRRKKAMEEGSTTYTSTRRCKHGHDPI